jgi:hypothetical protein
MLIVEKLKIKEVYTKNECNIYVVDLPTKSLQARFLWQKPPN